MTNHTYQGHRADGGGLQNHSVGGSYPYGILGVGEGWAVVNFETGYAVGYPDGEPLLTNITGAQFMLRLVVIPGIITRWVPLLRTKFTAGGVKTLFSKD